MSFLPVVAYVAGILLFGFVYGLMDYLVSAFHAYSETGYAYQFLNYLWLGVIIIYLIGGGYWVIRKYSEDQYPGYGGGFQ